MKNKQKLSILRGLLFTYCVENSKNLEREETIASKDINSAKELAELFDILTKPEFLSYREDEQQWLIETLQHFLETGENFESVFYLFDTYFEDEILDKRAFMETLFERLKIYNSEASDGFKNPT
ncbi:hypothetical protein JBE38_21175 [Pseudomonas sp. ICBG1301]|uniref:hypothetical protein n=1 Tax=Pseudomonas sp. ICBG1301 TaxID=2795987 RepID=UPI0019652C12|nr:hypothetical protein [Pseudomonas sp. ICBG1301]MBM9488447.1 hypothetical protein [Pseudomonas sp. ICBG1301]